MRASVKQKQPGWSWAPLLQPPAMKMCLVCWGRLCSPTATSSQLITPANSRTASHHHAENSTSASETGCSPPALLYMQEAMPSSKGQLSWQWRAGKAHPDPATDLESSQTRSCSSCISTSARPHSSQPSGLLCRWAKASQTLRQPLGAAEARR